MPKKLTTEEFIVKAILTHGDKYGYEQVNYINTFTKVKICCNTHGIFEQSPESHLQKYGCPYCGGTKKYSTQEFINKAILIHGDKYNYDSVVYVNNSTKIKIACDKHGIFEQVASKHLIGQGCIKCSGKEKSTTENFIDSAISIHGNKYNYSNADYVNNNKKIEIICNIHGSFFQSPYNHLNGQGCKLCNKSIGEKYIESYLNTHSISYLPQYKFDDLKYKRKLAFDFAIFKNNKLNCLIEYNGKQHYDENHNFYKSKIEYNEAMHRDRLKIEYCTKNNIPLLIIKYEALIYPLRGSATHYVGVLRTTC